MSVASSSHRTNPEMMRSMSDRSFCPNGGDDAGKNGLTQGDPSQPSLTKPTTDGDIEGTTDSVRTLSCHHGGHFDPYYYVILGSL